MSQSRHDHPINRVAGFLHRNWQPAAAVAQAAGLSIEQRRGVANVPCVESDFFLGGHKIAGIDLGLPRDARANCQALAVRLLWVRLSLVPKF
jgi:hypothetical protein